MGFMTTVTFLNDIWHVIKDNPQDFIDAIEEGMNYSSNAISDYGIKNRANGIEVARSHHEDVPALYLTHHNYTTTFGRENDDIGLELRKKRLKIARTELKLESDRIKELESDEIV